VASEITTTTLEQIARLGGLELAPERLAYLLPQFVAFRQDLAKLEGIDLGETEPAIIFIAGRED
jgi:hypothetical protein